MTMREDEPAGGAPGARGTPPREGSAELAPTLRVSLPPPYRHLWRTLAYVGAAGAAILLGGAWAATSRGGTLEASDVPWVALGGIALCVLAFVLEPSSKPHITAVEGDPRAGTIHFLEKGGGVMRLPRVAFIGAKARGTESSGVVCLEKRDGSRLDLVVMHLAGARAKAARLQELFDSVPLLAGVERALAQEAERRLVASPHVQLSRGDGSEHGYRGGAESAVELSWSKASKRSRVLTVPLFVAGMVALVGEIVGGITMVPVVLAGGLTAGIVAVSHRGSRKRRERVRIDDQHLVVDPDGGALVRVPLTSVLTVNATFVGPMRIGTEGERGGSASSITIDTFRLPVAERVALELFVESEVARRTGRAPEDL